MKKLNPITKGQYSLKASAKNDGDDVEQLDTPYTALQSEIKLAQIPENCGN